MAKRYVAERGTPLMNHLFVRVAPNRLSAVNAGVAEVVSVLVRKRNARTLSAAGFAQSMTDLSAEVLLAATFTKIELTNKLVAEAIKFIPAYSINATDAVVLRAALELADQLRAAGD